MLFGTEKLEWCGYPTDKKMKLCLFVLTQSTNVTDTHTDTAWWLRPRLHSIARQKLAIFDEHLVDYCLMAMCDHYLDDRLSLSHVSRRRRLRRPRVSAVNNIIHWWIVRPRISGELFTTQATEATSKTICQKHFKPLFGDPYRYRHQKGRSSVRMTDLLSCKLSHLSVAPAPRHLSPDT